MHVGYAGITRGGGSNVNLPESPAREHTRTLPKRLFWGSTSKQKGRLLSRNLPPSNDLSFHRPYSLYSIPFVDSTWPAKRSSNIVA